MVDNTIILMIVMLICCCSCLSITGSSAYFFRDFRKDCSTSDYARVNSLAKSIIWDQEKVKAGDDATGTCADMKTKTYAGCGNWGDFTLISANCLNIA